MNDTLLLLIAVPSVTSFIGYVTNWAAVKMIFHPRDPIGVGRFAWQGIIYRLAPKLAGEIATTTGHVFAPADLIERLDIEALIRRIVAQMPVEVDTLIREALDELAPGTWESMTADAREQLRELLVQQVARVGKEAMDDLADRAGALVDFDRLVVEQLSGDNADRLAHVAEEVGAKELRFIEWYGGVFGFAIGLVQAAAFSLFGQWWTMPMAGAIVGLGTNWLAIQMIFRPLEPTRFLGLVTYQGMFPKRQAEIAADYGRIAANEVFTASNLIDHVLANPSTQSMAGELEQRARNEFARLRPMLTAVAATEPTDEDLERIEKLLLERFGALANGARPVVESHLDGVLGIHELIESRLSTLDKRQFERMLRGIFEEDEIILVVIGAVLGGAVGTLQGVLVLSAGW